MNENYHPPDRYHRLAGTYSFWEYLALGRQLQRCRLAFWQELANAQNVLLLGDGNGRFSTHLLQNMGSIQLTSLEVSSAMLVSSKKEEKNSISPMIE